MTRECGECTLCCRLLPVRSLNKKAGHKCPHQRFRTGCSIYNSRPMDCRAWSCGWLVDEEIEARRPDKAHYVIDVMLDFVRSVSPDGASENIPVVQIWVDPRFPDSHQDPALRSFLLRMGQRGVASLLRYSSSDGFVLFAPTMSSDGQWHEVASPVVTEPAHTIEDVAAALGAA